jgi:hypothetical protein
MTETDREPTDEEAWAFEKVRRLFEEISEEFNKDTARQMFAVFVQRPRGRPKGRKITYQSTDNKDTERMRLKRNPLYAMLKRAIYR